MLYLQDFNFSNSYSLHEALIKVCSLSSNGKGAYAFVSRTGAEIFLGDIEFEKMLDRGSYQLIVGIDEITDISTVHKLSEIQEKHHSLEVLAFLHDSKNSLFHPKISYFSREDHCGILVIGSGNLTAGGLRQNREAFAIINLSEQELVNIEAYWNEWIAQSRKYLRPLTDDGVLAKVHANTLRERAKHDLPIIPAQPIQLEKLVSSEQEVNETQEWSFQESNKVLLAEIPRSGNRWNQANFDLNTFESFFGAKSGDNSQRILLRNVLSDKNLGKIEVRPSVSVVSQNYRFELEAAAGLDYPVNGRPIGIFIRLSTRMFIYKLFMPGSNGKYAEIVDWMNSNWTGRADRMKRIVREVGEIKHLLKDSTLDSFLVER